MSMNSLFASARRSGTPLVAIRTADPMSTIQALLPTIAQLDGAVETPVLQWDAARGITPVNKRGSEAMQKANIASDETIGFTTAMKEAVRLPDYAILFVHNAHRQLQSQEPIDTAKEVQSVSNLRDHYKRNFRMLIMLGSSFRTPPELEHDVTLLDHPLPTGDELRQIVTDMYETAKKMAPKLAMPTTIQMTKFVDALTGLSFFAAEQVCAMSMTENGLDLDALWERKRTTIEQAPGLSIYRGKEMFCDIVGQDAIKAKLQRRIKAKTPIGVVVWIDEIDKALANVESDTSGTRMYQLLKLLTNMENKGWHGFVAAGVAGGGKSLIAKALGNEAGVPTISLDLGATESKYVGESEANINRVMDVIEAVGNGHAYFVATSNAATIMRPELQRRFTDGFWMFDLMSPAERKATWKFYVDKFHLSKAQTATYPDDDAWTGAEIRNCCQAAWDMDCTLGEASESIIPMARSRGDEVERLRQMAHGKFLDANRKGPYRYAKAPMETSVRAIKLPSELTNMSES